MGRRIVLGVVGAVAAAVCAFVIVVLVRGGLAEAGGATPEPGVSG